jgi:hypothetical protein
MMVIDLINESSLLSYNDLDGTEIKGKFGNICIDAFYKLAKDPAYSGKYTRIFEGAIAELAKPDEWKNHVNGVTKLLRTEGVSTLDWYDAVIKTVRETKVPKSTKEILRIYSMFPLLKYHEFTGSEEFAAKTLVQTKITPLIPNAKVIEVNATPIEYNGMRGFTGETEELWDSKKRANKVRKLISDEISAGKGISIGRGNSPTNDMEMLELGTRSFFYTGPTTEWKDGELQGNIVFTKIEKAPQRLKEFLKTDVREIIPQITNLNAPLLRRRF